MGGMSVYIPDTAHIRLKVVGTAEKVGLFHYIAGTLDPDYPLAPPRMRRTPGANLLCPVCNGLIYLVPALNPAQLKAIAAQINANTRFNGHLKIKVLMYNCRCPGMAVAATAAAGGGA